MVTSQLCPNCKAPQGPKYGGYYADNLETLSADDLAIGPQPNSYTVCLECATPFKFNELLEMIEFTEDEWRLLPIDERSMLARVMAMVVIRSMIADRL
jgi:hypothetical protein